MKRTLLLLLILLATMALPACGGAAGQATPSAATIPAPDERPAATGAIVAEGVLVPETAADLAFQMGGTVVEVIAGEGRTVAAGDPLIRLDSAAADAAVAQAEAGLAGAEAALASARAAAARAEAGREQAQAALLAAEAQLALVSAGARPEEILAAERELAAAESALAQAAAERDAALDVSDAAVSAAEARLASSLAQLTSLQEAYDTIVSTCVELPDGSEVCPLLGPPEEKARAQVEAAEASYAAAQLALEEARSGATTGQRQAAAALVAVAAAQRDVAAAQLALLRAGARPEQIERAEVGVAQAQLGVSQADIAFREAAAAVAQAEAGVRSAETAVATARRAVERMTLAAPFDGTVAEVTVEAGELVAPGVAVARLAGAGGWVVETTDLVELDAPFVSVGQPAAVRIDALPGETLRGSVVNVGRTPEVSRGDVVYRVRVALEDYPDLPLRWGMTAVVEVDR